MNKLTNLIILAFTILIIASCTKKKDVFVVGYLIPSANRLRFVNEGKHMAERLKEEGITTIFAYAEDNDALQLQQGYELLQQNIDLLVITPVNGNTIAPLVRDAINKKTKVIAYNRLINNANYDLFFTGNNADNARLFCEAALSGHPKGNYVLFAGDRFDRNGFELKQNIDSILKPHIDNGNINMIYSTYIERWNKDRAMYEFQQVIDAHGTDIDVVICCNDPMALGVIEVLKKYNMHNKVLITGQDAIPAAVKSIYNNEIYMTIYHPHRDLGRRAAEIIIDILKGKTSSEIANTHTYNGLTTIPTYSMKSIAITKDNLHELIDAGEYTWDQISN